MSSRTLPGPSLPLSPTASGDSRPDEEGGDGHRADFDNGTVRYDWDLSGDERGDMRGSVGAGARGAEGDVYVAAALDESTGRLAAEVTGSRDVGRGVTLRGNAAGVLLDEEGFNPGLERGEVGAHYVPNAETMVDAVVGNDDARGTYAGGDYNRRGSDVDRARASVSYSERDGLRGDYRGDHSGETWETHETVRVRGSEVSGTLRGAGSRTLGDVDLRGRGAVDSRGDWSASGHAAHSDSGATLHASAGGTVHNGESFAPDLDRVEVGGHYPLNARAAVDAVVGNDAASGTYARGDYNRSGSDVDRARASVSYSERDGLRGDYRGDHSGETWETHETVRVRGSEVSGTLGGAGARTVGGVDLRGRGAVDSRGDWSASGNAAHADSGATLHASAGGTVHNGESFAPDLDRVEARGHYPLNATTSVDAVVGNEDARGVYASGDYNRRESGSERARTSVSYSERDGLRADYRGDHSGENWETRETVTVVGADVSGTLSGAASTSVGDVDLEGSGAVDSRGDWSASGSATNAESGATLRASARGTVHNGEAVAPDLDGVEVSGHFPVSATVTVDTVVGRNDTRGTWARGDVRRSVDSNNRESLRGEYSRDEGFAAVYRGDHRVNDALTIHEEATLREDGTGRASVRGDYRSAEGARLEARAGLTRNSDRSVDADASYGYTTTGGVSHRGTVRRRRGEWEGDLSLARDVEGGGESAALGYSERSGWRGSMNTSRRGTILGGTWNTRLNAEEGEGRFVLGGEGGLSVRSSASAPAGGEASVRGGLETTPRKRVVLGEDWLGDLRRDALSASEDATFVRYGGVGYVTGKAGGWVRAGGARLELGAKLGRRLEVEHIRLTTDPREGQRPSAKEIFSGVSAEAVSGLRPGESVTLTGEMTHAWNASVGAGYGAELAPGLEASARAGVTAKVAVTGRTKVEVVREQGDSVRLVVTATDTKKAGGGIGAKISIGPDTELLMAETGMSPAADAGPIATVAGTVADSALSEFLRAGVSVEQDWSSADRRLAEALLDLSDPTVRAAYDLAVEGDWSQIEALRTQGHPGVSVERSIFTEMEVEGQPLALYLFGLSMARDSRETIRSSEVIRPDGFYEVDSDLDVTAYNSSGWFSESALAVEDFTRRVRPEAGLPLPGTKGTEHWLKWESTNTDDYTSKEDVLEQLAVAFLVSEPEQAVALHAYRQRVEALPGERKFWVGPRNELRKTTVSTRVTISDSGLDRLSGLDEAKAWETLGDVWRAVYGTDWEPQWLTQEGREYMIWDHELRSVYDAVGELPADFLRAQVFVKALVAACGGVGEESRNDIIREAVAGYGGGVALGTVMELAGRDHLELMVKVDSNVGDDEAEFDFAFSHRGEGFDVERRVFGADL